MREYRDSSELIALFCRHQQRAGPVDFTFVRKTSMCWWPAVQRRGSERTRRERWMARPPGTGKTKLADDVLAAGHRLDTSTRWSRATAMATPSARRTTTAPTNRAGVSQGSTHSALLFDEVEDVFPPISSEAARS
jgi:hypothetical protein